jgi:hypothetical protein
VAPLRLGGLRGKQSTPSDWLGGTGEGLYGRRAGAARSAGHQSRHGQHTRPAQGNGMLVYFGEYNALDIRLGIVRCCISCCSSFLNATVILFWKPFVWVDVLNVGSGDLAC